MPLPSRLSGTVPSPSPRGNSGGHVAPNSFEGLKRRVLAKLEDRLDPNTSKRMPVSLLRQSIRSQAEQVADQEIKGQLARPERDRLVDEVLAELLGYGPLDELFRDPAVREIMVTGPHAVLARRDQHWLPTNVKFRDEEHVRDCLEKIATHADAVGGILASMAVFDVKLPNGFRVVAVMPPEALGQPASAVLVRGEVIPTPMVTPAPIGGGGTGTHTPLAGGTGSRGALAPVGYDLQTPAPQASPLESDGDQHLARYRTRITDRILKKMANLGVFDLRRIDPNELRKVVAAYVAEYCQVENIYLSDTDQAKLTLEILTGINR